jgi:hypothetical protein
LRFTEVPTLTAARDKPPATARDSSEVFVRRIFFSSRRV